MTVNIKDMIASLDGRFPMDETVLTCPPISPKSHTFEFFGKSVFTVTDKLTTVEADDTENVYFHKVTPPYPGSEPR